MAEHPHLLIAAIDVDEGTAAEFDRWYDEEHIPERAAVPGIGHIRRWRRLEGNLPASLVTYEVASAAVLESGPYAELKSRGDSPWTQRLRPHFRRLVRGVFRLEADRKGGDGPVRACAVALTTVAPGDEAAYRGWYDQHGALVAAVPGVVRLRRFERAEEPAHLTVVELTGPEVLTSESYAAAKDAAPGSELRMRWQRQQGTYALRGPGAGEE